jgi:hypothetical protein
MLGKLDKLSFQHFVQKICLRISLFSLRFTEVCTFMTRTLLPYSDDTDNVENALLDSTESKMFSTFIVSGNQVERFSIIGLNDHL